MRKKKVFVTGACGFIGSHLVEDLVVAGYHVKAFTFYNSFNTWGWLDTLDPVILDSIEVVAGDVRDFVRVKSAMETCNAVIHLAALIAIPYSYVAPQSYIDTNITGTLNVLQAARDLEIEKFIHTSTSEVYGTAQFVPITEEHPLNGQSPYAASKIGADQIAMSYYYSFKTPVTTLRPFNTYGPRQSARAVIPTIISQINARKKKLNLGSLHPTRDFNFVKDTTQAFVAAIDNESCIGNVINIGSNYEVSIGNTAKLICELMGSDAEIVHDEKRLRPENSEVERLYSENLKAKELLGWEPKFGQLEGFRKGLTETIEWFSLENSKRYYKADIFNV